jgi:hypothetical protein
MESRVIRVVLETDRYVIEGDLTLPREGHRSRLSDFLNSGEMAFVPLVDVELKSVDGHGAPRRQEFAAVSRAHIRLAHPAP